MVDKARTAARELVDAIIFDEVRPGQDVRPVLLRYRNYYQTGMKLTYRDTARHTLSYRVIKEIDRRLQELSPPCNQPAPTATDSIQVVEDEAFPQ